MSAAALKARIDALVAHANIATARIWVEFVDAPKPMWLCALDTPAQPTGVPLLKATSDVSPELAVEALAAVLIARHEASSVKLAEAIQALSTTR